MGEIEGAGSKDRSDDETAGRPAAEVPEIVFGPLSEMVGYQLRRAQLAVFHDFNETVARYELRPAEFSVLLLLRHNPGVRQSRLGDALGIKRANFVPLLDRLAVRGWAERQPVAEDRRAQALFLTAAGDALLSEVLSVLESHEAKLTQHLGRGGQRQLLALLARLAPMAG